MTPTRDNASGPAGPHVLTFLFSDIEGSTRLLERLGAEYATALEMHHAILRDAIAARRGVVQRTEGDSFFATFEAATPALMAAVDAQRLLMAAQWPSDCVLLVRMGLHTGEAVLVADELVGLDIHRAARIMSVGWGGQVLVSSTTADLLSGLDDAVSLRDLGDHRLKDLAEPQRIYQVVAPGLRSEFPALRSLDAVPNNLPVQLTSFVGRRLELAEVGALLRECRALTLTGPGGTGKTRLSLQVAAEAADDYRDGVFFVPLSSVSDPALVMSAVASVLGLTPAGGRTPLELAIEHLQSSRALLVLDNFEQVVAAAVDVSKLLSAAPDVTVLITSRAALRISGEQEYAVPPLPVPSPAYQLAQVAASDAAALFIARAAGVKPGFQLNEGNAPAVAEITRRLDGLPLAIELAAARVKLLPVEAIAGRLGDALSLLSTGARDLPDRQRTLRGAIAWSHDLLDEPGRRFFAHCSVFRGGMELDQLEDVCGPGLEADVLDVLSELVDQSLMRRLDVPTGVRFAMLETIREFAAEQLEESGEADAVRRRHARAFLAVAEQAARFLTGEDRGAWLDRLERDHDNLRAALRWAVDDGDARTALRLVAALWRMWQIRGHLHEGRRNADLALALEDADQHPAELAAAYEAAGGIAYWQGDLAGARRPYGRALDLRRELGDDEAVARSLYNFAFSFGFEDPARSKEVFQEALAAYEQLGNELGVARVLWGLMVASFWSGDFESMRSYGQRCLPVFRAAGETFDLAWALHMLGTAEYALGDYETARPLFVEALEMFEASADASGLYLVLADFAVLSEASGDPERALRLFGAVDRLADETGSGLFEPLIKHYPRGRRADEELDEAAARALRAEGYAMSREQAVAYALGR